ncbi:hypothetical protein DFJ74DRAFT_762997 [Hyaloraphidium curvatum]|nr:hypothetical protein DFJ74DRAFT_762997 [Hyaloraphidium curvatum]
MAEPLAEHAAGAPASALPQHADAGHAPDLMPTTPTPPPFGTSLASTPSRMSEHGSDYDRGQQAQGYRKQGLSTRVLPGDWRCHCGVNNFASRTSCIACGSAAGSGPTSPDGSHSSDGGRHQANSRPGDWYCQDPSCRYHNYSTRSTCHRCNAPKPEYADSEGEIEQRADSPGAYSSGYEGQSPSRPQGPAQLAPFAAMPTPPGMPYPMSMYGMQAAAMAGQPVLFPAQRPPVPYFPYNAVAAAPRFGQPPVQMKKGDWICSCGDLNFARRDRCRMCGLPGGDGYHARMAAAAAAAQQAASHSPGSPQAQSPTGSPTYPSSPTGSYRSPTQLNGPPTPPKPLQYPTMQPMGMVMPVMPGQFNGQFNGYAYAAQPSVMPQAAFGGGYPAGSGYPTWPYQAYPYVAQYPVMQAPPQAVPAGRPGNNAS